MATWKNLDTLASYSKLAELKGHVNIADAMAGEKGAERVKKYSTPMAAGLTYNYAAKQVDETVLDALAKLADEAELIDKFQELYNGAVINTGEKRMVLHHLARTQLGKDVVVDGVNKREFYVAQQKKAADFANKVHAGEITNENGEKFTTVVQIGIGGSDLGPRALYIALENWAKANNTSKMEAKFISNVDPDDAAAVLASVDLAHALFIVVSKSGTTLETLTNEAFVKNALVKAGLNKGVHEGHVAAEVISGLKHYFDPKVIPSIAYTEPEVAWVGLTEKEAKEKGISYETATFPWAASGRAIASDCADGMTKLIFDKESHRVIGGAIVGTNGGELLGEIGLAIEMGCDAEDIALTIHAHPTLHESVGLAAEVFEGSITDLPNPKAKKK